MAKKYYLDTPLSKTGIKSRALLMALHRADIKTVLDSIIRREEALAIAEKYLRKRRGNNRQKKK